MFGEGKKRDIIIKVLPRVYESQPGLFNAGGIVTVEYDRLDVWCEHGFKSVLEKVDGVFSVAEDDPEPRYRIGVDPRYDTQWVMREIEAAVKISEPKKTVTEEFRSRYFAGVDFGTITISGSIPSPDPEKPKKHKKKKKG